MLFTQENRQQTLSISTSGISTIHTTLRSEPTILARPVIRTESRAFLHFIWEMKVIEVKRSKFLCLLTATNCVDGGTEIHF